MINYPTLHNEQAHFYPSFWVMCQDAYNVSFLGLNKNYGKKFRFPWLAQFCQPPHYQKDVIKMYNYIKLTVSRIMRAETIYLRSST